MAEGLLVVVSGPAVAAGARCSIMRLQRILRKELNGYD